MKVYVSVVVSGRSPSSVISLVHPILPPPRPPLPPLTRWSSFQDVRDEDTIAATYGISQDSAPNKSTAYMLCYQAVPDVTAASVTLPPFTHFDPAQASSGK